METHLTCLLLLRCPLLNPFREMHPPARWETQLSRDSLSYYIELCAAQRQYACGYDLLHSSWALSLEADVDPYGLIFEVLQVLNLHIYCTLDIWASLSAALFQQHLIAVSIPKYKYLILILILLLRIIIFFYRFKSD